MKLNNEAALKTTIELAKANIESTDRWVDEREAIHFMAEVYAYLTGERKAEDE